MFNKLVLLFLPYSELELQEQGRTSPTEAELIESCDERNLVIHK